MNRSSGLGLTVFGIVLVTVGATLRFAVSAQADSGPSSGTTGASLKG